MTTCTNTHARAHTSKKKQTKTKKPVHFWDLLIQHAHVPRYFFPTGPHIIGKYDGMQVTGGCKYKPIIFMTNGSEQRESVGAIAASVPAKYFLSFKK